MRPPALALIAALLTGAPAQAHHSTAMFDGQKELVLDGVVKQFQYTNPHSWLLVAVARPGAAPAVWALEMGGTSSVQRAGVKRTTFKPGDHVQVTGNPSRDGKLVARLLKVAAPDGQVIYGQ